MNVLIELNKKRWAVDLEKRHSLSIPLRFNGDQPSAWESDRASAKVFAKGDFVANTQQGGSCNVEEYRFTPHCNGTHTECVGHISNAPISLHEVLNDALIPATLISVNPQDIDENVDRIPAHFDVGDKVITRKLLEEQFQRTDRNFISALIVRTLPNDSSKQKMNYSVITPPYFTTNAMEYITELGVKHLLVDVPSVDRMLDNGLLSAHRVFWNVPENEKDIDPEHYSLKTITEMIYVPPTVVDGAYLLNLQIPAFETDAAPSRPILFEVNSCDSTI